MSTADQLAEYHTDDIFIIAPRKCDISPAIFHFSPFSSLNCLLIVSNIHDNVISGFVYYGFVYKQQFTNIINY